MNTIDLEMAKTLPKFDAPPVVETVLAVQFDALAKFSEAHVGIFAHEYLRDQFTTFASAARLPDVQDIFAGPVWRQPGFEFRTADAPDRVQVMNTDEARMLQFQDNRFIYNWRLGQGQPYPSYETLKPEFDRYLKQYREFVSAHEIGQLNPRQWEVTYVNHIPRSAMWRDLSEWGKIIPAAAVPRLEGLPIDTANIRWQYLIKDTVRLVIEIVHGKVEAPSATAGEVMVMKLSAKGPITDDEQALSVGLDLGHEVIVSSFASLTSAEAHKAWRRNQ